MSTHTHHLRSSEHSCQTCYWNLDTGSHHSCTRKPALASNQVVHVQTLRAYAPGVHRSQSCLPGWHDESHRRSTRFWETSIRQQFPIWNPIAGTHVWWARFSHTLDQKHGTHFHPISRNSRTLILLKNNWKLTCLSSPMNEEYDFVEAPLITSGVNSSVK